MNGNELKAADHSAPSAPEDQERSQRVRKRRLGMAIVSYLITFSLVGFLHFQGMVPLGMVVAFPVLGVLINGAFFWLIHSNRNLKFADPSLTSAQVVLSCVPPVLVMYYLEEGQARAIFLLIAMVPVLYGILALETKRFLQAVTAMIGLYVLLLATLKLNRPEVLSGPLEVVQLFALIVVLIQTAWIGGYINQLRRRLRQRNLALNEAMGDLHKALETIKELASRDELTGTFNRRHLLDTLTHEVNRYERAKGPFSICMMDVDHFKQVNDTYGHAVGDEVLRRIAESVGSTLRNIDCLGRYGGEEFMLVLPQTSVTGAMIKAERTRAAVEMLRFSHPGGSFGVTVSIGVAEFDDDCVEQTMRRADDALYKAKADGRNRVVRATTQREVAQADRPTSGISTPLIVTNHNYTGG